MKKVAYFFAGFLPVLTAVSAQVLAMTFLYGIAELFLLVSGGADSAASLETVFADQNFNICLMILYTIISIVLMGLFYYSRCGGNFLVKPSRTFHVLELAGIVVLVPGMQFLANYLAGIAGALVPAWLETYNKLMENAGITDVGPLMFLYAVLLGPVCEELIFRGVTMRLFRQALPFWLANIFQALLFGIFHLNWIQGIYAFALGLVLGYICERGGSIYHSILFHILFNFYGTTISKLFGDTDNPVLLAIVMFVGMLVSLTAGFMLFASGLKKKEKKLGAATVSSAVHE